MIPEHIELYMTEEQKKMLTELIGECWRHEIKRPKNEPTVFTRPCKHCKKSITVIRDEPIDQHRTFLTPDDQQACKEALVREGLWSNFVDFAWNVPGDRFNKKYPCGLYGAVFMAWLFRPVNEAGEAHFCALVAEFLEAKEKNRDIIPSATRAF